MLYHLSDQNLNKSIWPTSSMTPQLPSTLEFSMLVRLHYMSTHVNRFLIVFFLISL